jgi:hypothetical protein
MMTDPMADTQEAPTTSGNLTIPADALPGDCKSGEILTVRLGERGQDGSYKAEVTGKQDEGGSDKPGDSESLGGDY